MNKLSIVLIFLILLPVQAMAKTSVQATVDRTRITRGESLSLRVTITDGSGDVDTSVITDFDIVSKSSGTNISIVNGSMTRTKQYSYTLVPPNTGNLTIPPLPVDTGDGILKTSPISITVTKKPTASDQDGDGPIFVRAHLSAETGYVGQQLVYTVSVFQSVNMSNGRLGEPRFPNMSAEKLKNQKTFDKVVNGRSFRVTQLFYLLTPNQPGEQTIGPATLSCDVYDASRHRSRTDSLFDDPFFSHGRRTHKSFRSNPVSLTIRALPGRPVDAPPFSGLIGRFSIDAKLDKTELATGDSTTLTLTIAGTGNIQDTPSPPLSLGETCKTYADEPVTQTRATPLGTVGSRTFSHALVPTEPGKLTIPPVSLNWLDPGSGTYRTMATPPMTVTVTRGTVRPQAPPASDQNAPAAPGATTHKQDATILHKDILPLYGGMDATRDQAPLAGTMFGLCLLLPPLAFLGLLLVRHHRRCMGHPSKRYRAMALSLLKEAGREDTETTSLCSRALLAAIASRTHALSESLTYEEAEDLVTRTTGNRELATEVRNTMLALDTARYGSSQNPQNATDQAGRSIRQTKELVDKICA
ncbi:BatD family protein [Desulfoplanes sp.]